MKIIQLLLMILTLIILALILLLAAIGRVYQQNRRKHFLVISTGTLIGFSVIAFAMFWLMGGKDWIEYQQQQTFIARTKVALNNVEEFTLLTSRLRFYLDHHAKNATAWYLYGRILLDHQQPKIASEAFHQAARLQPQQINFELAEAEAILLTPRKILPPALYNRLEIFLQQNPNNINLLNILAINSYKEKKYDAAQKYFQRMLRLVPPDSKNEHIIQQMILQMNKEQTLSLN